MGVSVFALTLGALLMEGHTNSDGKICLVAFFFFSPISRGLSGAGAGEHQGLLLERPRQPGEGLSQPKKKPCAQKAQAQVRMPEPVAWQQQKKKAGTGQWGQWWPSGLGCAIRGDTGSRAADHLPLLFP